MQGTFLPWKLEQQHLPLWQLASWIVARQQAPQTFQWRQGLCVLHESPTCALYESQADGFHGSLLCVSHGWLAGGSPESFPYGWLASDAHELCSNGAHEQHSDDVHGSHPDGAHAQPLFHVPWLLASSHESLLSLALYDS